MGPAGGPGQDYVNRFARSRQVLLYLGQNCLSGMAKQSPRSASWSRCCATRRAAEVALTRHESS